MRTVFGIAVLLLIAAAASVGTYAAVDPIGKASIAQKAILREYVDVYCHPTPRLQPFRNDAKAAQAALIGQMALLSRLTIEARLGPAALIEWGKCKV